MNISNDENEHSTAPIIDEPPADVAVEFSTVQLRLFDIQNPLRERVDAEFFKSLPKEPGVYWMLDGRGRLLYVGKSRNLKQRVSSYRSLQPGKLTARLSRLIFGTELIRFERTESETKALDVEARLLRLLKPPCNTAGVGPEKCFEWRISEEVVDDVWTWKIQIDSFDTSEKNRGFRSPHRVFKAHGALLRQLHGLARANFSVLELPSVLLKGSAGMTVEFTDARWKETVELFLDGVQPWPEMICPMDPNRVPDLWSADVWDQDQLELKNAFEHLIRPLRLRQLGLKPEDVEPA